MALLPQECTGVRRALVLAPLLALVGGCLTLDFARSDRDPPAPY